jgi:GTP cyclohydrolase IA
MIKNEETCFDNGAGYEKIEYYDNERTKCLSDHYYKIISMLDDNIGREGLVKSPERAAKAIQYLTNGYSVNPEDILKSAMFKEDYKEMVIVKDIEIFSLCEHHLLPFFGKAHIAYIPNEYITGLSKLARVADAFSRRLQVQERLTVQIRDCIEKTLKPLGVAVVIEAKHLCMIMRGIQKQNSITTTSAFTGEFLENARTRDEFIHLISSDLM